MIRGRTAAAIAIAAAVLAGSGTAGIMSMTDRKEDPSPGSASVKPAEGTSDPRGSDAGAEAGMTPAELGKLNKAWELIREKFLYPVDRDKLIDGAIAGMVEALDDPFSAYYSQEEAESFSDSLEGAFTGIGAKLAAREGEIVVERVMAGTPAERAGLKAGDALLAVNGQNLEGLTLAEAIAKIRGPKGTKAKLKVRREGAEEPLSLELVRDRIAAETVSGELGDDGVGRLKIAQFTFDTPQLVADRLAELESGGMKALVVDVRGNPGGVVSAVEAVAELFVPSGRTIVIDEDASGERKTIKAGGSPGRGKEYPIVVLVNGGSASSSEILAGALKQSAGALLVGSPTYGKGTAQVSYEDELGDGSLMKLTVMKWFLPDGTWVQGHGLQPDIAVDQPDYYAAGTLSGDGEPRREDLSRDVLNLQLMLEGVGFAPGRKDGYFSEGTEQAVKAFQQSQRLEETGVVDAATAERLQAAFSAVLDDPARDAQWQAARTQALALAEGG